MEPVLPDCKRPVALFALACASRLLSGDNGAEAHDYLENFRRPSTHRRQPTLPEPGIRVWDFLQRLGAIQAQKSLGAVSA